MFWKIFAKSWNYNGLERMICGINRILWLFSKKYLQLLACNQNVTIHRVKCRCKVTQAETESPDPDLPNGREPEKTRKSRRGGARIPKEPYKEMTVPALKS